MTPGSDTPQEGQAPAQEPENAQKEEGEKNG